MSPLLVALLVVSEVPSEVPREPKVAATVALGIDGAAELVLIGDTGESGPLVERWKVALQKEKASAVLVLGDLVYPQAPPCPQGVPDKSARALLDRVVHAPFSATGKEVFLVIGNHDISWDKGDPPRERCLLARFGRDPQVRLPAAHYAVDLGVALLVVFNSNALDDAQAAFASQVIARHPGRRVIFGAHHVLRTYHDKENEDLIAPWLAKHGLRPDMWINGHAHLLQLSLVGGVVALTSGTASKPRERPACDRMAGPSGIGRCGEQQLFGSSTPGYAVLRVEAASAGQRLSIVFKDVDGVPLWRWAETAPKGDPGAAAPRPSVTP